MLGGQKGMTLVALGFEIAASVVGGILLGLWLDGKAGWSPFFLILGVVAGMAGATLRIIQVLKRQGKEE